MWVSVAGMALQVALDNWFNRNVSSLKTVMRVIFGIVWCVDGALKFAPGFVAVFPGMISHVASGQPWLAGWFSFWASVTASNPGFFVYSTGILEVALAICLVFGLLRKLAYGVGFFLSLLIWSVPEGFGGPYGPGSTDIGTGIVYAIVFVMLLVFNATYGPSKYSLDFMIESRWPGWKKIAEIKSS